MTTGATDNQRMASEPVTKAEANKAEETKAEETGNVRFTSEPNMVRPDIDSKAEYKRKSLRQQITFSDRKFDVKTLPVDMQRVVGHLTKDFGEEYALTFAFMVRTASELHRAWHMTLLTTKFLQQVKDKFQIRTTWELGVTKLKFRVEDGRYELHRRVPYDYDSEFQDLYAKIAIALVDGHINIHQALQFQSNTKRGKHTAASGLFLRDYPGRIVLYPLEAATCAVIFFGGDWTDAGVAAATGLAAGLVEWFLSWVGGGAKILNDVLVGITTGIVGGLFYKYLEEPTCLPSVFLGVLYWFFYGTAFVIGILEIVAGELNTGVIRFMSVAVKTFVLSLGSTWGLQIVSTSPFDDFSDNSGCNQIDLDAVWWRIPLYLLCSASALGQYRFPIVHYWRGLAIQLVGYEVQYQVFKELAKSHDRDLLDTATANGLGAIAAVLAACLLSWIVDSLSYYYNAKTLMRVNDDDFSSFGECMYKISAGWVRFTAAIGLGRKDEENFLDMQPKLRQMSTELEDPTHTRSEIRLTDEEERLLKQALVAAEPLNVWSLLMPTVYQLVPGSLIARLWYNSIFPPAYIAEELPVTMVNGTASGFTYISWTPNQAQEGVFSALMVIATSLALGLLLGMGLQSVIAGLFRGMMSCFENSSSMTESTRFRREDLRHKRDERVGLMNMDGDDDPDSGELFPEGEQALPKKENVSDEKPASEASA